MDPDDDLARHGRELRATGARMHALRTEIQALWEERAACPERERVLELTLRYLNCQAEWDREYASFRDAYATWSRCYRALVKRGLAATRF